MNDAMKPGDEVRKMSTPDPKSGSPVQGIIPGEDQPKRPLTITIFGDFDDQVKASIEFGTRDASGTYTCDDNPAVEAGRYFDAETESIVVPTLISNDATEGDRYVKVTQGKKHAISTRVIITLVKEK